MLDSFLDIRLRDLRFFSRLAELGSITATARELGVPKATASRWLSQLEERLGAQLVKRTTRSVALTDEGFEFARRALELVSAAQRARLALQHDVPGGTLRVSVPVPMGRVLAGPVIARFRDAFPRVRLEFKLQNERVDLIREGVDLAIRGGPLPDSEYIARRLCSASMWIYASARFREDPIDSIPLIASPGDAALLRRASIGVTFDTPSVIVDDRTAVADALTWGAGLGLLPAFLGHPSSAQGSIVKRHADPIVEFPIHAIYHASQRSDPRIQALVDEIAHQLGTLLQEPPHRANASMR